jgi:gamma-glutamyltranspeptidase / glutathione hydrolase
MRTALCLLTLSCLPLSHTAAPAETTSAKGMVVATTGVGAADTGLAILKSGGTAMDAAMATSMLQPCLAVGSYVSYAGIILVVYYDASTRKVYNLDAAYNTVRGEKDALTIPGPTTAALSEQGARAFGSTTPSGRTALVPGFLAGVEAAHQRFGKLPFDRIVEPAIRCAEDGFPLQRSTIGMMKVREAVLDRLPETKAIFTKPDGTRYRVGETFKQPALAKTLRSVMKDGVRKHIYEGPWARNLVATLQRDGGLMTMEDLKAYEAKWIEPAHGQYNGYDIYGHGAPATGGTQLIQSLQMAAAGRLADMPGYGSDPHTLFQLMQIGKITAILNSPQASAPLGKQFGLDLSSPGWRLNQETSNGLWRGIQDRLKARGVQVPAPPPAPAHTDSVIAVDERGNVAAVVHTINTVVWGATGIFVDGISIPDSASFQQRPIAALTPGARLPDTTNPGIVLKDGQPVLGFGAIGSGLHMRSFVALVSVLGRGLTPQQAIDEPSLGGFNFGRGGPSDIAGIVGQNEFSADYLKTIRDLGQKVNEDNGARGYWIGISIDPKTGTRHAGIAREIAVGGGGAAGY